MLSLNKVVMQESKNSNSWTDEQNTWFESALAIFDTETPDRWSNVAALVPGKSEMDVKKQYERLKADINKIESGLVDPADPDPSFKLELAEGHCNLGILRKRPAKFRSLDDHERRKGVPWTEEEHRRFLMGLQVHGKGDWRSISRNFVMTKTPTQVASHAQKYYARQHADGKEKRRPSIHDITMLHNLHLPHSTSTSTSPERSRSRSSSPPHTISSTATHHVMNNYPTFEIAKMQDNVRVLTSGLHFHPSSTYQVLS